MIQKKAVDLTDLAIGIIVLGIVVSIGAYILITYRDTLLTDSTVATTSNESITPTDAGTALANKWGISVSECNNGSNTIAADNYTVSIATVDGTMSITNLSTYGSSSGWNCSYNWYNTSTRADYTLANDSAVGLAEYGNWFKIIVIVGVAAVVLSLIFMAFGRRGQSTQSY